jgi:hypothetical protein
MSRRAFIALLGDVYIVYRALADVIREAPCFGPSTTTSAPIFTRL